MLTWILIFIAALAGLLVASRFFTKSAEQVGEYFNLSLFVIGVFITGIGTSLPELVSSIIAVTGHHSEIVSGNIIGANLSNIFLIVGLASLLSPRRMELSSRYILIDFHYLIGSAFMLGMLMYDGVITTGESVIMLGTFLLYSIYVIKHGSDDMETPAAAQKQKEKKFPRWALVILPASAIAIYFGASYTVMAIEEIAARMHVPSAIISLTALSLGTTLPEIAVNVTAIRQGKSELAIGNVLGSCVFNALAIPGVAGMFGSISVPVELLVFPLPALVVASIFFYLLTLDKKISRWEGGLFIIFYLIFILKVAGLI